MACQILNGFGINRSMDQVRDVGMTQLMGRYLKVQTVYNFSVVDRFLTQYRLHCMGDFLSVHIRVVGALFRGAGDDILPDMLELRIGQRIAITVGNNIFG